MTYTLPQRARKIIRIALPSGGNSLLDVVNIALGMLFIAHISPDPEVVKHNIVALGLSMNGWMFLFALTTIFYIGTNAQLSRAYGARDSVKMESTLATMSLGGFVCSLPILALAQGLSGHFLEWLNADSATKRLGVSYLSLVFCGIPAFFLKMIFISALAAIGDTKNPFFIKLIATTLNIALNYALIFGLPSIHIAPLGIIGAGVANLIITYLECAILLLLLCGVHKQLRLRACFELAIFVRGVKLGLPSSIERALTILSLTLITKFMAQYGLEVIAGFQIGGRVESFIFMPGFGFQVAAMSLTGQMLGLKRLDLAQSFIYTNILLASVIMGILGVGLCVFGGSLAQIFSTDSMVIHYSAAYLIAVGLSQVPQIWIFVLDGALRGSGATKLSLVVNTSSIWILRILPMWLCVHLGVGVQAIFIIICAETFARAVVFWCIFRSGAWVRFIAKM